MIWSALVLSFALDTITPTDSAAIQKAAREHLKADASPVATIYMRGDTAHVHVGDRVSQELVRVVRREGLWVALKDQDLSLARIGLWYG